MAYSLYIDRNENFECDLKVKNASLKNANARLVVNAGDLNLMFEGDIRNGRCVIPIRKMRGILPENTKGDMHLEVIVEDTYFKPWKSQFIVEEHTSVKVQVMEQKTRKPIMEVSGVEDEEGFLTPSQQLAFVMERVGINRQNIQSRKSDVKQVISEFFTANPTSSKNSKELIRDALSMVK